MTGGSGDDDNDDDMTPVVDDGSIMRSKSIDWSWAEGTDESICMCRSEHGYFASHVKFDMRMPPSLLSRKPCPVCGSHELRSASSRPEKMTL